MYTGLPFTGFSLGIYLLVGLAALAAIVAGWVVRKVTNRRGR